MNDHTPGPWYLTANFEVGPRSDLDDQSFGFVLPLADVFGDNAVNDARLICAAPDLLYALESLYALVNRECPSLLEDDHHDEIVYNALKKAGAIP